MYFKTVTRFWFDFQFLLFAFFPLDLVGYWVNSRFNPKWMLLWKKGASTSLSPSSRRVVVGKEF
jgi:hypothetical protein